MFDLRVNKDDIQDNSLEEIQENTEVVEGGKKKKSALTIFTFCLFGLIGAAVLFVIILQLIK